MSKPPEPSVETIGDLILDLSRRGHGSYILLAAAQLDNALEDLICQRMPKLSNTARNKLFRGLGAFAHFSTKIDVAYAMELISDDIRHDMHVLRDIRNEFAHPKKEIHLHLDDVIGMMGRFRNFDDEVDRLAYFIKKINEIWSAINAKSESNILVKTLRDYAKKTNISAKRAQSASDTSD